MSAVMNVAATITVGENYTEILPLGQATTAAVVNLPSQPSLQLTNGTSTVGTVASVIDLHWESPGNSALTAYTLAASASLTLVLSALTDSLFRPVAFARIRTLLLQITSSTGNDYLTIGDAASDPWVAIWGSTGTEKVYTTCYKIANNIAGYPVIASTGDQFKIVNSGSNPITFTLALTGNST